MTTPPLFETAPDKVRVDVWSDVMCPFCYIGDTHLARAVEAFDQPVDIHYRSYQLMPELPTDQVVDLDALLEEKRGFPPGQDKLMNAQVTERAAEVGLTFRMDKAQTTNTRSAHRLSHFAKSHGRQHELIERLFRAYFTDGLNVGDHDVLADLAAEVGLDRAEALEALTSDAYAADVDNDVAAAHQLGISGVPFFVIDGKWAISGAQPVDMFTEALTTAWDEKSKVAVSSE
ncbi:MAG: DsbA family oxidoreductase [Rhodococcus sp.]|nr:DsbA family oxidoreductase [Rhodococcus sp. (in: high G+C Gram-positive bacteria)]